MISPAPSPDDLLKQGIAAVRAGRKDEARQKLMLIVETDEENEQAWLWLSSVVESDADRRLCLENVLALNPANAAAQRGLRLISERAPRPRRERCPHCQADLPAFGTVCAACQRPVMIACPNCCSYVEIVIRQCPQCSTTLGNYHDGNLYYLNLADAYWQQSNLPLVQWALEQVSMDAAKPRELLHMAELAERLTKNVRAMELYRAVIERDSCNPLPYLKLGAIYRQLDQREEMHAVYASALRQTPDDPQILLAWAQALAEQRAAPDQAIGFLQRVLQRQPDNLEAQALLARLYLRADDPFQASTHYRRVAELAAPQSRLAQEAQRELTLLSYTDPQGWGEFVRHTLGLMLCPIFAALSSAQLLPWKIDFLSWLLLGLALCASTLWISSADMPHNPVTVKLFGATRARQLNTQFWNALGKFLWALAFVMLIVWS